MNHIKNDKGEWAIAIGADGSLERVKAKYPALIQKLDWLYCESVDCPGRAVDKAIELIRATGIRSEMETNNLLAASNYSNEQPGSVTSLVASVARSNKQLFFEAYSRHLRQCLKDFPKDYAWPVSELDAVLDRMFAALEKQSCSIDSPAFKRTAKELGIKPTRKAIFEFWKGGAK